MPQFVITRAWNWPNEFPDAKGIETLNVWNAVEGKAAFRTSFPDAKGRGERIRVIAGIGQIRGRSDSE